MRASLASSYRIGNCKLEQSESRSDSGDPLVAGSERKTCPEPVEGACSELAEALSERKPALSIADKSKDQNPQF